MVRRILYSFGGVGAALLLAFEISYLYFYLQPLSAVMEMELEDPGAAGQESLGYIKAAVKKMDIVLWSEAEKECYGKEGNDIKCTVITKAGDSRLIFPQSAFLDDDDPQGCILSKEAARSIWGSESAVGLSFYCDGKEYIVRRVADLPEKSVLINVLPGGSDTLHYLTSGKRGGSIPEKRQWLQTETGVSGNVWNYHILNRFMLCLIILNTILLIIFFRKSVAAIIGTSPGKKLLEFLFSVLLITGIICLAIIVLTLGGWPARWSDFGQWSEKGHLMGESVRFLARSAKPLAVVCRLKYYAMVLLANIAMSALLAINPYKIRRIQ